MLCLHAWAQEALRVWEHLLLTAFPEPAPLGDQASFFQACVAPVLDIVAAGPARWKPAERLQRRQHAADSGAEQHTPLPQAQPMAELFGPVQLHSLRPPEACMGLWLF